MEPNRVGVRHNNMTTESVSSFRADPAAVCALGQTYRNASTALSTQVAQVTAAATALHPDALGSVGAVFANALAQASHRHAGRVAELGARLTTAEHTASASAASFLDADARVAAELEVLR
jgi:hypothetical protein